MWAEVLPDKFDVYRTVSTRVHVYRTVSTRVHMGRSRGSEASPVSHTASKGTGAFIDSSRLNCELARALDQTSLPSAHKRTEVWFA